MVRLDLVDNLVLQDPPDLRDKAEQLVLADHQVLPGKQVALDLVVHQDLLDKQVVLDLQEVRMIGVSGPRLGSSLATCQ